MLGKEEDNWVQKFAIMGGKYTSLSSDMAKICKFTNLPSFPVFFLRQHSHFTYYKLFLSSCLSLK